MFESASTFPTGCRLLAAARRCGVSLAGLAVVALEAWLRMPLRPLLGGGIQDIRVRAGAFIPHRSF
jgi:hypothetical protein